MELGAPILNAFCFRKWEGGGVKHQTEFGNTKVQKLELFFFIQNESFWSQIHIFFLSALSRTQKEGLQKLFSLKNGQTANTPREK